MKKNKILAIDQGTTGTTCLVIGIDHDSVKVCGRGYAEVPQHFPEPGWVEHDLNEIWQSTSTALRAALNAAQLRGDDIAAIGITNQRETTGLWDVHSQPVHRAIVWQDRRTAPFCRQLTDSGHADMVRRRTGLVLDPYFSGTKLRWLLAQSDFSARAARGELRFGTMDTWLVWRLTGGMAHVTDVTNASRTMMFDIHTQEWHDELLQMLGDIPRSLLPTVHACNSIVGYTRGVDGLPDGIPIAGMAGDQHAALFGQACFAPNMAKCTYGTGAFALVNTGSQAVQSHHGLLTTIAWRINDQTVYALEGSVFIAGAAVQWLRDGLGFIARSEDIEALAQQVPDSGGVMFVPALTGLGAPYWRPDARGVLSGLTRGTTRAHIARATLEGIAMQVRDLLDAMRQDSGAPINILRVDGGASANNLLMQFQSDVMGVQIHRPTMLDTTALGAAFLAALGVGLFRDLNDVARAWQLERVYMPDMPAEHVAAWVQRWQHAVSHA